jgi:hypothetical protein
LNCYFDDPTRAEEDAEFLEEQFEMPEQGLKPEDLEEEPASTQYRRWLKKNRGDSLTSNSSLRA